MIVLETPRLLLRTAVLDDAPFYLGLLNEPSFIAHIGDRGVRTLADARAALASGPLAMQAARGHSLYVVERRRDAAPLGLCGLIKRDSLPDVDLGYALLPPYWGAGYAYEAGAAVVAHARDVIGLTRLLAITGPDNVASNALLRKLGLRFARRVQLTDDDPGTNLYTLDL